MSNSLNSVLEYLAGLHRAGKSYSAININRSMLSKTLPSVDGHPVGTHPLVKKLLNGCYNLNPPRPKYNSVWDPDVVIKYVSTLGENRYIPLPALARKTAVLLALASLLRVSELSSIDMQSVVFSSNGIKFTLLKPRKAQHSGPLKSIVIPSIPDAACCPVEAIRTYIDRTSTLRKNTNINSLFISLIAPYRSITANTMSGWIRSSLKAAGVDTAVFKAHSTRGAAASKALASGLSLDSILKAGQWSRESTFSKFYQRDILPSVASTIIDPTSK